MPKLRLFHASEEPGIRSFVPRPVPSPDAGILGDAVWAVDEKRLPNYLLPRDCPRVTFSRSEKTSASDREKFFLGSSADRIVAVESEWFSKIESCRLFLYEFPAEDFELVDSGAGYYVSRKPVVPDSAVEMGGLVSEILRRNVELRFLPDLRGLREAVVGSTLEFSLIRYRNARRA